MLASKMTRKGQVTIPAEIRDRLHLNEGELFTVREENGLIIFESQIQRLRRAQSDIARHLAGHPPIEPSEIRELATQSIASTGMETLRQIEQSRQED